MSCLASTVSPATASSSKGKAPLHDTESKTTPPRYSTLLPKLPLPINPTLPTPFLPPPPPPKDLPLPPPQPEFIAYPTFAERKMHISSPAFILLLVLLFLESTVIFIYTTIGLVKNNPLPYLYAPVQPPYPLCQDNMQVNYELRYGLNIPNGAVLGEQQISYATSTSTVYSTLITTVMHPAAITPPVMPNLQLLEPISTTIIPAQSTTPASTSDTNAFVTSIIYSTTTQSATPDMAQSTTYSTTIVAATTPATSSSIMLTSGSSKQADVTPLAISSTSSPVQSSILPMTTTTVDSGAVITSIVFSTTVLSVNSVEALKSTVYLTTVVPGR